MASVPESPGISRLYHCIDISDNNARVPSRIVTSCCDSGEHWMANVCWIFVAENGLLFQRWKLCEFPD